MGGAQMTYLQMRQDIFNGSMVPMPGAAGYGLRSGNGMDALSDWQKQSAIIPADK
jgi:hypothetical protein